MTELKIGSRGAEVKTLQGRLNLVQDGIFGHITAEAVRDFQKRAGLTVDGIVGSKTWAALGYVSTAGKRVITAIILHCTATPEGREVSVATIRAGHLARGFSDIGYHYLIGLDGTIHKGRPVEKIGAHCTGQNAHSIGVSYVGGVAADGKTPKDTRTKAQRESMARLVKELLGEYPGAEVKGHRDYSPDLNGNGTVEPCEWIKACPSFDVKTWLAEAGIKK